MLRRPLVQTGLLRPDSAVPLAGGNGWFTQVAERVAGAPWVIREARSGDDLSKPRTPLAGLVWDRPHVMGIVNVTPDSFSDGGVFAATEDAVTHAIGMARAGVTLLDIGGESTRPGAITVPVDQEIARVVPVIEAIRARTDVPISVDTRKSRVARAALEAGADIINDVSALTYDPDMAEVAAEAGAPLCLMHAQGDPATMQQAPSYADVVAEVYEFLRDRLDVAVAAGIARDRIIVDPGIGFGKTIAHNLALLRDIAVFHGLGCPVLLGASRKRFIGTIGGADEAAARMPGSLAVALDAARQGVQILRVHDTQETLQALALQAALTGAE